MSYATHLLLVLTTVRSIEQEVQEDLQQLLEEHGQRMKEIVLRFVLTEITPASTYDFEREVAEAFREHGRQLVERIYNQLESDDCEQTPHDITVDGGGYRRRNQKTRNQHVGTLFGRIELYRYSYRYWHRDGREGVKFPLEIQLGLVHGATPALAEAAARYLAQAGATQQSVLDRLQSQHGVRWGPPRLRAVARDLAEAMERYRQECQVQKVLELLEMAEQSGGRSRPVLAVGRDGVTLREHRYSFYEHASAGTVSVYDRRGRRLGTVYLAQVPESGQRRMTEQLTALIEDILRQWKGRTPRLCYVTDAGDNETKYYRKVLCNMRHPVTGQRLGWIRIVDYYHAAERVWTMADALFGNKQSKESHAWARRMCRVLMEPGGPGRVLRSAAALRARRRLSQARAEEFRQAYNYIRRRTRYMHYHHYQKLNLPIGSGVTEAACKTIFAQRLKLSGMRWGKEGAQVILNLRICLLGGVWTAVHRRVLESSNRHAPQVYNPTSHPATTVAA